MNILTIPARNMRRKALRSLLLLTVFSLGVTAIVCLGYVSREVGHSLEKKLLAYGANILVTPKAEALTVSYGGFNLGSVLFDVSELSESEVVDTIRSIELKDRISAVAPKLVTAQRLGPDAAPVGVVGVRFEQEMAVKSYWGVQGAFPTAPDEILAGSTAAQRLNLKPGDSVPIGDGTFTVSGVLLPTGSDDDAVLLADLGALQQATGQPGRITFAEVSALCAGCPIDDITREIATALPDVDVKALRSVVEQRMTSVHFVQQLTLTVSLVILLTACAMVGLSMLSAVNERKKEIGILRSLGYAKTRIFAIFAFEAFFLGIGAGLIGYAGGWGASFKVLALVDEAAGAGVPFSLSNMLAVCAAVALLSVASSTIPALKAARVRPSEALLAI